jgi:hypothetical protein
MRAASWGTSRACRLETRMRESKKPRIAVRTMRRPGCIDSVRVILNKLGDEVLCGGLVFQFGGAWRVGITWHMVGTAMRLDSDTEVSCVRGIFRCQSKLYSFSGTASSPKNAPMHQVPRYLINAVMPPGERMLQTLDHSLSLAMRYSVVDLYFSSVTPG